ncbi:MAG: type II toxin-antitoxin system death-on-curing family toxin [Candidatus Aquicultorales bacterium]
MKHLTVKEVEEISFQLAKKHLEWGEPTPDFSTRFPGILEGCLGNAFQTFAKKDLYPGINEKAAILFYQMVKNHPFLNGNKRIAVTALLTFLYLNNRWLGISNDQLYQLAVWVAASPPESKDGTVLAVTDFLRKNTAVNLGLRK